jgi:hypothetical protein
MADTKSASEGAAPSAPRKGKRGPITKTEAVRRALGELGNDAKPARIQGYVKDNFKIDMTTDHISTCKGDILRKARLGKTPGKQGAPKGAAAAPVQASAPRGNGKGGILLTDILEVKRLVQRVGPAQLRTLIDAFSK